MMNSEKFMLIESIILICLSDHGNYVFVKSKKLTRHLLQ